ncbi:hypothetical protein [Nocardioides marmotae]|uniref:Band 7 domain-containing protein n=1 Tax=Nocardioides marmotae TaxID=2663857 RepID=A0A6I3JA97_9ACTN|nr:hypothetical protein [Nocardioides marmotae]MCR6031509.1 hypothetical protein [Gordonia jinghuaiqii]MBC9733335.1 hypothetical protein [Nocardioides marmotae]MTB84442.1 hypothetical protein [Nocardioides marmotae]MTB95148.1 hypothetical protein [Nocardioides marmotae]QKE02365.1 hypothetical protein HPC71_15795 [Nocardioides marmotae]
MTPPFGLVLVIVAVGLAVWATVAWAGAGRGVAVLRRGRVVRVADRGPVPHLPLLEEVRGWPTGEVVLPLLARATTRDGTDVRVLAELRTELSAPRTGTTYVDPVAAAERRAEDRVVAAVGERDVVDLLDEVAGLAAALPAELELVEVDAVLAQRRTRGPG